MSEKAYVLGSERIDKGSPFQIEGPATEKARFCLVEVRAHGTRRRPRSAERRGRELRALCVGHIYVCMYAHMQVLTKNFNSFDTDLRRTVSGSTCHGTKYLSLKSHM